jgi:hypothetical protein
VPEVDARGTQRPRAMLDSGADGIQSRMG